MKFERRLKPIAGVDLVPMIDVVFQLVIFFMLSSTFIQTPGIALNMPESSSAEPVVVSRLVVTILPDETLYLNDAPYTLSGLDQALKELPEEVREAFSSVIVDGDTRVDYGLMVRVMDVLRHNGFTSISLRVKQDGG